MILFVLADGHRRTHYVTPLTTEALSIVPLSEDWLYDAAALHARDRKDNKALMDSLKTK